MVATVEAPVVPRWKRAYTGLACPVCATAIPPEQRVAGKNRCPRCRKPFMLRLFTPQHERGALPMPATGDSTPCAFHATNSAAASCTRCGSFICSLCVIPADGQDLCPGCFDRLAKDGVLPSARQVVRNWNGMAFHVALLGVFLMIFGLLIGPAAIWLAIKGISHNRRTGERISHVAGWVAVVLGTLVTIGGAVILLFFLKVLG